MLQHFITLRLLLVDDDDEMFPSFRCLLASPRVGENEIKAKQTAFVIFMLDSANDSIYFRFPFFMFRNKRSQ
jgi:hypothetical protein